MLKFLKYLPECISIQVRGFHARDLQKGPVPAIAEGGPVSAGAFFFHSFILSFILCSFFSHPDSCLTIYTFVGKNGVLGKGPGGREGEKMKK